MRDGFGRAPGIHKGHALAHGPKGYSLNLKELISVVVGRVAKVDREEIEEIIEKDDVKKKE